VVSLEEGNLIATISTCTMKKWPSKRSGLSREGQFNSHYIYMYNEKVAFKVGWSLLRRAI
jgi:hypothetical protein